MDEFLLKTLNAVPNSLLVVDTHTRLIVYANQACQEMYGYCLNELLGMPAMTLFQSDERDIHRFLQKVAAEHPTPCRLQAKQKPKEGLPFPAELTTSLMAVQGRWYALCQIENITEKKRQTSRMKELIYRLNHRAYHDYLTGLHNRAYLFDVYTEQLAGQEVALLLLDIDHFKEINDTYGHLAGDQILKQTAAALRATLRPCDAAIRFGGDEFLLVLPSSPQEAVPLLEGIRNITASGRYKTQAAEIPYTVSIGMTHGRVEGSRPIDILIKMADIDLYRCKQSAACGR